jgi:hypothetical protein
MIETLKFTGGKEAEAQQLDQELIDGRRSIVGTNLAQMTGIRRSEKFVARKAGLSTDMPRRSETQDHLQWIAATAIEDPNRMARVEAFWTPVFDYARSRRIITPVDFWSVQEQIEGLLSTVRRSFLDGNRMEARFSVIKIRECASDLLRLCDSIGIQAR